MVVKNRRRAGILMLMIPLMGLLADRNAVYGSSVPIAVDTDLASSNLAFLPQTINAGASPTTVTFRVTNNGPSSLTSLSNLMDGVFYLSTNNVFGDGDDVLIGTISFAYVIPSGGYTDVSLSPVGMSSIKIPDTALGSYYVFLSVQHNPSSVHSDPIPGNNFTMRTGTITVTSNRSDIVSSNLTFTPAVISAGSSPTSLNFRVTNNGPSGLASLNTRVAGTCYLSDDVTFGDADDVPMGTNTFDLSVASGSFTDVALSTAQLANIVIPTSASGNYYIFFKVVHSSPSTLVDHVPDNNHTMLAAPVMVTNSNADLSIGSFSFLPATISSGAHPDTATFVLSNNGPSNLAAPNNRVDVNFFISRNSTFGDTDDIPMGSYSSNYTVNSGSFANISLTNNEESNVTIPGNASGSYYVFVRVLLNSTSQLADPVNSNNYTMRAGQITVLNTNADLAVTGFTFLKDTLNAGANPVSVSYKLTNNGPANLTAPNNRVNSLFYISRNSIQGDTDDILIGSDSLNVALASGATTTITLTEAARAGITIPLSVYGPYFVFVVVRHSVTSGMTDMNADNDFGRKLGTVMVINRNADIMVTDLTFSPSLLQAGAFPDVISFRITNNGPADLVTPDRRVVASFFLSRNTAFGDADDILMGADTSDYTLAAGAFLNVTLTAAQRAKIKIPVSGYGDYSLFVRIRHESPSVLLDPATANNHAMKATGVYVVNTNADLALADFVFKPQTIEAGAQPDTVSFRLTNNGPAYLTLPNTRVASQLYLSRNNTFGDADDIPVGINGHDFTLTAGSATTVQFSEANRANITIPTSAAGDYFVFARVQHNTPSVLQDTVTANNYVVRAGTIKVNNRRADLAPSNFVFLPATINAASSPDSVSFRLTNNGPMDLTSPNTRVDGMYYLSVNNVFGDGDDILIGTNNFNVSLASGLSAEVAPSVSGRADLIIPATALGNYFVFVKVIHKSPSVLIDLVPGNDHVVRGGTINVLAPCNLSVTPGPLNFTFSADSKVLNVTSGFAWTATDNADWITLDPLSGINSGTVSVTVTENTGITRIGTVTIAGCGRTFYINVRQEELSVLSIKSIQGEGAYSPYVGSYQRILGTVSAVVPNTGYFLQDALTPWSGIWVEDNANVVMEGNGVRVDGTVAELNDVTTIKASKVLVVNPPLTITAQQVASPEAAKAEQYESVLVKVAGARFQGSVNLDGSWPLKTTELNRIFVNKWMYTYLPAEGHFYTVTGIVNGLLNNFRLEPRKAADIIDLTNTTPVSSLREEEIAVYPNPFSDRLNIGNHDQLTRLTITDMAGRIRLDVIRPEAIIRTGHLSNGLYVVALYDRTGFVSAKKFIKN